MEGCRAEEGEEGQHKYFFEQISVPLENMAGVICYCI